MLKLEENSWIQIPFSTHFLSLFRFFCPHRFLSPFLHFIVYLVNKISTQQPKAFSHEGLKGGISFGNNISGFAYNWFIQKINNLRPTNNRTWIQRIRFLWVLQWLPIPTGQVLPTAMPPLIDQGSSIFYSSFCVLHMIWYDACPLSIINV